MLKLFKINMNHNCIGRNQANIFGKNYYIDQIMKKLWNSKELTDSPGKDLQTVGSFETAPEVPSMIALPTPYKPLIPGFLCHYTFNNPKLANAIKNDFHSGNPYVGVFLRKEDTEDADVSSQELIKSPDQIYHIGSMAKIVEMSQFSETTTLLLSAQRRIKIRDFYSLTNPFVVEVDHLYNSKDPYDEQETNAYLNEIADYIRRIASFSPFFGETNRLYTLVVDRSTPFRMADFSTAFTTRNSPHFQSVLEALELVPRLYHALLVLREEIEIQKIQGGIRDQIESKMSQQQRILFLKEQLRTIQSELGLDKDSTEILVKKYSDILEKVQERTGIYYIEQKDSEINEKGNIALKNDDNEGNMHIYKNKNDLIKNMQLLYNTVKEECSKLLTLEKSGSEFNLVRTYLDWLTQIPWGIETHDNFNLEKARKYLDEDHYGLEKIKEQILEHIAVGKLRGTLEGQILCLVGPPGTGKTSVCSSIARSLGRKFARISLGGLSDIAEVKGHRRTYIGALPSKIIQSLKICQSFNPVILLDEIDKIGKDYKGDPTSALLEMLDPNQNTNFVDHYIDIPVDLSKILFICTANTLDSVPIPLLDRLTIINLSGYDQVEKLNIAKQYLLPKLLLKNGLLVDKNPLINITDEIIKYIIEYYCRESGIRNLEKSLQSICQKAAFKIVSSNEHLSTTNQTLHSPTDNQQTMKTGTSNIFSRKETADKIDTQTDDTTVEISDEVDHSIGSSWSNNPKSQVDEISTNIDPVISDASTENKVMDSSTTKNGDISSTHPTIDMPTENSATNNLSTEIPHDKTADSSVTGGDKPIDGGEGHSPATENGNINISEGSDHLNNETISSRDISETIEQSESVSILKKQAPIIIDEKLVKEFLGQPKFLNNSLYPITPPGVVAGLAWTSYGGTSLFIEARTIYTSKSDKNGSLKITGQIGKVMEESIQIAYSYSKTYLYNLFSKIKNATNEYKDINVEHNILDQDPIHIHIPEGATPKDGPSAGVTLVTSMVSLGLNVSVKQHLAMTGEISLTGKVLPVGGIKEKSMAAARSGIKEMILPKENEHDIDEISKYVKEQLTFHLVSTYDDVFSIAFPDIKL